MADVPFYYADRPALIPGVADGILALVVPIIGYWTLSLFFHGLDISGWQWVNKYRIHEADEAKNKELVTKNEVIREVLIQQAFQIMVEYFNGVIGDASIGPGGWRGEMENLSAVMVHVARTVFGNELGEKVLQGAEKVDMVYFLYWWGIPAAQFFVAMFIADTWEYFIHRFIHKNQFLYKNIHSVHHRIYVPYAFGALYSHPIETFVMDTLSHIAAMSCTRLTIRQTIFFFTFSALKSVDDHCGYRFPFDPLQHISGNNSDYHDVHHQAIGMKSNFSSPYFIHWDLLLGTRMTRIELQRKKVSKLA